VQAVLAHQGAQARQVALGAVAQGLVQHVGHAQPQHRVAQELQALVVVGRMAAVRQRALQQGRVGEAMVQALLQGLQLGQRRPCGFS
jgi:hypothetical protein